MKKQENLSATLKRKLPALKRFFASDSRVLGVWLFGSQVDGYATPWSDIDFGVLFARALTLDEQLGFEVKVCEILGTDKVDVVDLSRVKLPLRHRALSGKLLFERDYVRVSDFIEETLIEYPDYAYRLERFNEDYFEGMRQAYARFRHEPNRQSPQDNRKQSKATRRRARARA